MKPSPAEVTRIAILGAAGRMGRALVRTAKDMPGIRITAALVSPKSPVIGQQSDGVGYSAGLEQAVMLCDVVVDFSTPAASAAALEICASARKPMVIGVTGLDAEFRKRLQAAASHIPVLVAPNMSLGAALLQQFSWFAAHALGGNAAVQILDRHHQHKKDAPSGTALALGEAVAEGWGVSLRDHAHYTRQLENIQAHPGEILFVSVREGEIVGDHSVTFTRGAEHLELTHHAHDRSVFAFGALTAARWIASRQPGLYGMSDVLGLSLPH
ncbi:MAG: 4-hydroxy-tetrahydrodipicolinate reductase [Gammaproteobacteria bacterium]|nr:4-hydroxy-tetrahydrodipicolinate reductase [Gammaproteobacteria bacterium]MDE2345700.1 4-hydroxy-tetrahydrodipicolinate reductase [Gammaproteobacteria bacterium]